MKKRRLFLRGETVTDGEWIFCGGPNVDEALEGISMLLEASVAEVLDGAEPVCIEVEMRELSDEECDALPES